MTTLVKPVKASPSQVSLYSSELGGGTTGGGNGNPDCSNPDPGGGAYHVTCKTFCASQPPGTCNDSFYQGG
jgi:hypothetical protein